MNEQDTGATDRVPRSEIELLIGKILLPLRTGLINQRKAEWNLEQPESSLEINTWGILENEYPNYARTLQALRISMIAAQVLITKAGITSVKTSAEISAEIEQVFSSEFSQGTHDEQLPFASLMLGKLCLNRVAGDCLPDDWKEKFHLEARYIKSGLGIIESGGYMHTQSGYIMEDALRRILPREYEIPSIEIMGIVLRNRMQYSPL